MFKPFTALCAGMRCGSGSKQVHVIRCRDKRDGWVFGGSHGLAMFGNMKLTMKFRGLLEFQTNRSVTWVCLEIRESLKGQEKQCGNADI